jgi:hypothetical protein
MACSLGLLELLPFATARPQATPPAPAISPDPSKSLVALSTGARQLTRLGYPIAFLLVTLPLVEFALGVWPWHPSLGPWRVGTYGMLTRTLMLPITGLALVALTAYLLEHRWVMRTINVLSFVSALLLLAGLAFFALDVLQLRAGVQLSARPPFDVTVVRAAITGVLFAAVLVWLGLAARPGRADLRKKADQKSGEEEGVARIPTIPLTRNPMERVAT